LQGATGVIGVSGSDGPAGPSGPQGAQGATGADGSVGASGSQGVTGMTGASGSQGDAGVTGATGPSGPQGIAGTNGVTGPAGPTGQAGATGPSGSGGTPEYAYIYNLGGQTVQSEMAVAFDTNGVMSPGITHIPGTADIVFTNAGTYKVTFSTSGVAPSQTALFVNGGLVPGTIYGSGAGTQQSMGQAIVNIGAGDTLTLRNHTSSAALALETNSGGSQVNSNASVAVETLN
jgi:hypothetical protein